VIDDYNHEGLNIALDTTLNAKRVVKELDQLIAWRGTPRRIRVDNGPEYISETMPLWAVEREIELKFVETGSPYQNGYVERFNKSYREEVLDTFKFRKLGEARALTQA
jgi:putative transposase